MPWLSSAASWSKPGWPDTPPATMCPWSRPGCWAYCRDREPTMQELARLLDSDKSSVTGLVDRAEKRALVQRMPSTDDHRVIRVSLTSSGRESSNRRPPRRSKSTSVRPPRVCPHPTRSACPSWPRDSSASSGIQLEPWTGQSVGAPAFALGGDPYWIPLTSRLGLVAPNAFRGHRGQRRMWWRLMMAVRTVRNTTGP